MTSRFFRMLFWDKLFFCESIIFPNCCCLMCCLLYFITMLCHLDFNSNVLGVLASSHYVLSDLFMIWVLWPGYVWPGYILNGPPLTYGHRLDVGFFFLFFLAHEWSRYLEWTYYQWQVLSQVWTPKPKNYWFSPTKRIVEEAHLAHSIHMHIQVHFWSVYNMVCCAIFLHFTLCKYNAV